MLIAPLTPATESSPHQPQLDRLNNLSQHILKQTLLNSNPYISKEEKVADVLCVIRNVLDNFLLHNNDKQRAKAVLEQVANDVFHQYELVDKQIIINPNPQG